MSSRYSSSEEELEVFINNTSTISSGNQKRRIQSESESEYSDSDALDSEESESESSEASEYDDKTSSEEEVYGSRKRTNSRSKTSRSSQNSKNKKKLARAPRPKPKPFSGIVSDEEEEYEEDESDGEVRGVSMKKIAPTGEIPFFTENTNENNNNFSRVLDQIGDWNEEKEEFLVKWKGKSWKWAEWLSIDAPEMKLAKRKIENFIKKIEEERYNVEDYNSSNIQEEKVSLTLETLRYNLLENWCVVERVVAMKETLSQGVFYLCKWRALGYSECTWEWEVDVRGFDEEASLRIDEFLNRQYQNANAKNSTNKSRSSKAVPFKRYKEQPEYFTTNKNKKKELMLRDYQLDGLNWLLYSWCRGVNVILADEMGLGKTIQSVCFLTSLKIDYGVSGPTLLVVPLSTIDAWQKEFELWAGDRINVIVYTGDASSRATARKYEFPSGFDVLLTTYELVLKDHSMLEGIKWKLLLVDEGHRLKNSSSQLYDVLFSLVPTSGRVLITGTPLQNSLGELWCLLRFLMPDKFSDYEDFLQKYSVDLNEEENENTISRTRKNSSLNELHALIKPHILRRLKRDVENSLPGKTEKIIRVDLSPLQKQLYRYILTKNYRDLKKTQEAAGNRAVGSLVNILGELKKICNHPLLLGTGSPALKEFKNDENSLAFKPEESGKLVLLNRLLRRLKDDGHRVLIFSQSVRMLDLLQSFVKSEGYAWQRLDGSTTSVARHLAITGFNAKESNDFVFLLSTRAGGLGINLATADTVIIYDSDWNPQNDLQAMARAHRIGQKKMVRIFRLVSAGTVEEEILERAKRKMVLDHLVIQQLKGNSSDLQAILKFGAKSLFDAESPGISAAAIDLDSILAEVSPSTEETTENNEVREDEEFLGQFRMADLGAVPNWDEIIPEEERKRIEEEDKKAEELAKEVELQEALLTAATGRRHRRSLSDKEKEMTTEGTDDKENSSKSPLKRKHLSKAKEGELVLFNLSVEIDEINLVKAYESLSKFGVWHGDVKWEQMIYDRLEELTSGNDKDNLSSHFRIIPSGPLHKASLPGLLERLRGLKALNISLKNYKNRSPADIEMKGYRHSLMKVKAPINWPIPLYSVQQDSALLVTLGKFGYGDWQGIRQELYEKNSNGWIKLQGPQITRRVDYLLKEMLTSSLKINSKGETKVKTEKNEKKNHLKTRLKSDSLSNSNSSLKQAEEVRIIEKFRRPFKVVRGTLLALDGIAGEMNGKGIENEEVIRIGVVKDQMIEESEMMNMDTNMTIQSAAALGSALTDHLILLGDFIESSSDLKNDPEAWEFVGCFWPFHRGSSGKELKKLYEALKRR